VIACFYLAGYISAVAAQLLGRRSIHYGIELQPKLVEYSRAKLDSLELHSPQILCCDCYTIDAETSMRFDRIYVGAGAGENTTFLMRMLEVGGVLVGPFESEGGSQRLIKCHRVSEDDYEMTELMAVHFTPLAQPRHAQPPPPVSLCAPRWCPELHCRFPPKHQTVIMTLLCLHANSDCVLSILPKELLVELVFPHISYGWFGGGYEAQPQRESLCFDGLQERKRIIQRALRAAARAIFGSSSE